MKTAVKHEIKKILSSRNYRIVLALGTILVIAHFVSVAYYVDRIYYKNIAVWEHPMGLGNISLLALFLPADNWFMTAMLFYLVLPILSAYSCGATLLKERTSGYQLQVIARVGKKKYLTAKFLVYALSGFMSVFILLVMDAMLCATICPLTTINILDLISGVMQGSFASFLFYNYPFFYIVACILMSSVWGAVCAILALTAEMYLSNSFLVTVFPFMLMLIVTAITEYLNGALFKVAYEIRPLLLMRAAPENFNPAWYILLWQCGFVFPAVIAYFWRGKKRENL